MSWNQFTVINKDVRHKLKQIGFATPTPVQQQLLSNYPSNHHFIVASQTGSGKTLAFALPIVSEILNNYDFYSHKRSLSQIACLILTPTRELALQIQAHIESVVDDRILVGTLVGGLSKEKQRRIINKVPHIFIATPGRLWDFIQNEENKVIQRLNHILYLVIDEADRMVELGHFNDLDNIIVKITTPARITHDKDDILALMKKQDRTAFLNGKPIEYEVDKPVEMGYEDFVKLMQKKGSSRKSDQKQAPQDSEENHRQESCTNEEPLDEEEEEAAEEEEQDEEGEQVLGNESNDAIEGEDLEQFEEDVLEDEQEENEEQGEASGYKPRLRTFFVSATLSQQFNSASKYRFLKKDKDEKVDNKMVKELKDMVPKLQSVLGKLKIKQKPYLIDLTQQLIFPEKLQFFKAFMEEDDKLLYLYNYVEEHQKETFIIFLNSISYANKVTSLLDVLGLKSVSLHSQQQQRQRLKRLDRFTRKLVSVLVCTDVAARGLDIVNVENVIHYQIPFSSDTFVHRCGRTARINKEGKTLLMIGPKDVVRFTKIEQDLNKNGITVMDYKLNYLQINKTRELVRRAQSLEKENHLYLKKKTLKNALERQLKNDDADVDEKELKQELNQIEEELQQKRKRLQLEKQDYNQVAQKSQQKVDPRFVRRRNALFLTPSETMDLATKLKEKKEMLKQKEEGKKIKLAQKYQ